MSQNNMNILKAIGKDYTSVFHKSHTDGIPYYSVKQLFLI